MAIAFIQNFRDVYLHPNSITPDLLPRYFVQLALIRNSKIGLSHYGRMNSDLLDAKTALVNNANRKLVNVQ